MFAVIKTGGKQYRVQEGDILDVDKLNKEEGQKITFDQVLLVEDDKETLIGTPLIQKAQVKGVILENFKDDKVIVFKKKRRKQYKKKMGHRQGLTRVKIEKILAGIEKPEKKLPAKKAEEEEVAKKSEKKPGAKKVAPEKKPVEKTGKKVDTKKPKAQEKAVAPKKKPAVKVKAKASSKEKSSVKKET